MKKIFTLFTFALVFLAFMARSQTVSITFVVDMTPWINIGGTINQVHVAGQFASNKSTTILADWNPAAAGSKFANTKGNVYANTIGFDSTGGTLQFKFLCDSAWNNTITATTLNNGGQNSEGQGGATCTTCLTALDSTCGIGSGVGGYNRDFVIPTSNAVFSAAWDSCGTLTAVSGIAPLHGNLSDIKVFPSPAQSTIAVSYTSTRDDNVTVSLRNYTGQTVKVLYSGVQSVGIHNYNVDISNMANGIYYIIAQSGQASVQKSFEVSK